LKSGNIMNIFRDMQCLFHVHCTSSLLSRRASISLVDSVLENHMKPPHQYRNQDLGLPWNLKSKHQESLQVIKVLRPHHFLPSDVVANMVFIFVPGGMAAYGSALATPKILRSLVVSEHGQPHFPKKQDYRPIATSSRPSLSLSVCNSL
jgi:hypothetical protein